MTRPALRSCKEANGDCKAPAGFQVGGLGGQCGARDWPARVGVCFACGEDVCTASTCSRRVRWHHGVRRRVCVTCIEDQRAQVADARRRFRRALEIAEGGQ